MTDKRNTTNVDMYLCTFISILKVMASSIILYLFLLQN